MIYRTTIEKLEGRRNIIFTTSKNVVKYEFQEVTLKELLRYRRSGVPGVVYKEGNSLFYADFQAGTENCFAGAVCNHVCGKAGSECKHLSTASDEKGGCAKVRDVFIPSFHHMNAISIAQGKMLEKYDFIENGIEIFNSPHFLLNVTRCRRYEKVEPRETSATELTASQKMWNEYEQAQRKEDYARRYEEL